MSKCHICQAEIFSVNGDKISISPPENHEVKIRINYKWIIEEIIKRNGSICRNTTETLLKLDEEQNDRME